MKSVVVILALLSWACIGSGCATSYVRNIGARHGELTAQRIIVAADGSLAIEVEALTEKRGTVYQFIDKKEMRVKRYVVATRDVANKTVTEAVLALREKGEKPYWAGLQVVSPEQAGWHMIPYSIMGGDATAGILPERFRDASKSIINPTGGTTVPAITWNVAGEDCEVFMYPWPSKEHSKQRRWWFYPAQILVPPAAIIDAVTSPIQAVVFYFYLGLR